MTFLIGVIGQSGAAGTKGPQPTNIQPTSRVKAWDLNINSWVDATLGQNPFYPAYTGVIPNNIGYVFCMELAALFNEDVRLVLIASDGKKIEYFLPNYVLSANGWSNTQTSPQFGSSAAPALMGSTGAAKQAMASLGKSCFDVILMDQGEANAVAGDSSAAYLSKLGFLFDELDSRGIINYATTEILLGHINSAYPNSANHAQAIEDFASTHTRCRTVSSTGLTTVGGGDLHADTWGLTKKGRRNFNEYMQLIGHWPI